LGIILFWRRLAIGPASLDRFLLLETGLGDKSLATTGDKFPPFAVQFFLVIVDLTGDPIGATSSPNGSFPIPADFNKGDGILLFSLSADNRADRRTGFFIGASEGGIGLVGGSGRSSSRPIVIVCEAAATLEICEVTAYVENDH
jgi:hypothetical protein